MNEALRKSNITGEALATRSQKPGRRILVLVASLPLILASGWYARSWWLDGRFIESTDDAYVGGDTTALSPQVSGLVAEVLVQDNQKVSAGEVLVRINDRSYRAALARATANVDQQEAALQNLHARRDLQLLAIQQADAELSAKTAAATFAGQDVDRYRALAQSDAGSKQNAQKAIATDEQAKSAVTGSRAAFAAAHQQIKVLDTQISQAEASVAAAKADLESARLNLDYTSVTSPLDGFVGNRAARAGSYVAAGNYLLSVVPTRGLWIDANFKEDQLRRMKVGQVVTISADVSPDHVLRGRVASVAPATGAVFSVIPAENATGNFTKIVQRVPVRIVLDDAQAPFELRPGLSVNVSVDTRSN